MLCCAWSFPVLLVSLLSLGLMVGGVGVLDGWLFWAILYKVSKFPGVEAAGIIFGGHYCKSPSAMPLATAWATVFSVDKWHVQLSTICSMVGSV